MSLLAQAFCNIDHLVMFGLLTAGCLEIEIAEALCVRLGRLDFANQFASFKTFAGFTTSLVNLIDCFAESFASFKNYWFIFQDFVLGYHLESFYLEENFIILCQFYLINLFS